MPDQTETPDLADATSGALGPVADHFRTGTALVDAALAALTRIASEIETMRETCQRRTGRAGLETSVALMRWHLGAATIGDDNLLIANDAPSPGKALELLAVSKPASGALATQTISIERDALALGGGAAGMGSLDRLEAVLGEQPEEATPLDLKRLTQALDCLAARVVAATSRLSVIKSRLDLQLSFVKAVTDADAGASFVRLDSHINLAGARDLALETRRLLSRQSLGIGSSNRQVLQALFERHGS